MSFITQDDLKRRLQSPNNLANSLSKNPLHKDNDPVTVVTPTPVTRTPPLRGDSIRTLVGALAKMDGPTEAAKQLGTTVQQAFSAANSRAPHIEAAVTTTTERVRELALTRLMESLGLLEPEKLLNTAPKDLAQIAQSMSKVVSNLTPKVNDVGTQQRTLVIYAPKQRKESDFEVIDI